MKDFRILIVLLVVNLNSFCQETIIIQPGPKLGKDAKIQFMNPNNNLGDGEDITAHAWTMSGNPNFSRSFIQFDLSSISLNSVIFSAKLSLYFADDLSNNPPGQYGDNESSIYRIVEDWDEHTITWNNQPQYTIDNAATLPVSDSINQSYPNIDVTKLLVDMINNPESSFGFMLKLNTEVTYRALDFASSDYLGDSLRPRLEITFGLLPSAMYSYQRTGDSLIFINESVDADTYYWDFGDGFSSTLENPIHHYLSYNKYNVCLKAYNSLGESTFCDSINICPQVNANFQYQIQGDTVFFVNLSSNALTYFWDFGDGYGASVENPFHYYASPGSYNVCLTATCECSVDTICESIDLTNISESITGIKAISVYPNPASDFIYLRNNGSYEGEILIEVYSQSGKRLFYKVMIFGINTLFGIDVSSYSSGNYVVRLSNGKRSASRIIQIK